MRSTIHHTELLSQRCGRTERDPHGRHYRYFAKKQDDQRDIHLAVGVVRRKCPHRHLRRDGFHVEHRPTGLLKRAVIVHVCLLLT